MEKIISALKVFYSLVEEYNQKNSEKIFWILTGSLALAIQGVDLIPSEDIDIITNKSGSEMLDKLLSPYVVKKSEYSSTDKYRSFFGIYKIEGIQVEVMAEFQYRLKDGGRSKENQTHKVMNKKAGLNDSFHARVRTGIGRIRKYVKDGKSGKN